MSAATPVPTSDRIKDPPSFNLVMGSQARFRYRNHEGKEGVRVAIPRRLFYGKTVHHAEVQWFLVAYCLERRGERHFALKDMGPE